jgi:hypothetical protein
MAAHIANSSPNSTEPLAVRCGAAKAKAYRSLDEFRRQLQMLGIDPDSVIGVEPLICVPSAPPPETISADDPDWLAFRKAWKAYEELDLEWKLKEKGLHEDYLAWCEHRNDQILLKFGRLRDRDSSEDKAGNPNNPPDCEADDEHVKEHVKELDLFEQERKERSAKSYLPIIKVPLGWKSLRDPFYKIRALIDVEPWLDRALKYIRELQFLGPNKEVARDEGVNTVNNCFLLLDELRISDRPKRPDLSKTKSEYPEVDAAVSDLLAGLREKLLADAQVVTTSPGASMPKLDVGQASVPVDVPLTSKKTKLSTEEGDAQFKLNAALTKHHGYYNGSCLNQEPIGNNELARQAEVDKATASAFFKKQFKGHGNYKVVCAKNGQLLVALMLLNGDFPVHILYGTKPPREDERDEQ